MADFLLISEAAIEVALTSNGFLQDTYLPIAEGKLHSFEMSGEIIGYRVEMEPEFPYFALIKISCLHAIRNEDSSPSSVYRRIVRVIKGLKSPPVHLPRQWSEYHYKNLIAFFALPREVSSVRWVVELNGEAKCAKFDFVSSNAAEVELAKFSLLLWPSDFEAHIDRLISVDIIRSCHVDVGVLAKEVDLEAIGSSSVAGGRTYSDWERMLTESQKKVLDEDLNANVRIVGPAGSGKTLALCMRALKISRDESATTQGKKVLIATHSWAMAERVDGILNTLNGGIFPEGITVFPLLSLLEFHAGSIRQRVDVIGDDSTDGRYRSIGIIQTILDTVSLQDHKAVSPYIRDGLTSRSESRARLELAFDIYEEISGVITASGVASDDPDSIRRYVSAQREEWMPPFASVADRSFVIFVYKSFVRELIDRSAITTDQFILDSIRILETFAWRIRKETDGYDYILVDELQYFDPQERSALELLGRSRIGIPFITAEDPSQAVFAALNSNVQIVQNAPLYLETVHRFDRGIFDLITFLYQKFPLNALALRISEEKSEIANKPEIYHFLCDELAVRGAAIIANKIFSSCEPDDRICLATLGDVDAELVRCLREHNLQITILESFDDVEQLAYSKRSVVVAPWQFVGGTQFASVIVVAAGIVAPSSQFARLREQISVYLACSRAAKSLTIVCGSYIPANIGEAEIHNLLLKED